MKKGRFILIILGTILLAPSLGGFWVWIINGGESFTLFGAGKMYDVRALITFYLPLSYTFGLITSFAVAMYGAWTVIKRKPMYKWRAYLIGFILFYINGAAVIIGEENVSVDLSSVGGLFLLAACMTPPFFVVYFIVKKLLPWAGTSLIKPT